jgi:hypothetical protein
MFWFTMPRAGTCDFLNYGVNTYWYSSSYGIWADHFATSTFARCASHGQSSNVGAQRYRSLPRPHQLIPGSSAIAATSPFVAWLTPGVRHTGLLVWNEVA